MRVSGKKTQKGADGAAPDARGGRDARLRLVPDGSLLPRARGRRERAETGRMEEQR